MCAHPLPVGGDSKKAGGAPQSRGQASDRPHVKGQGHGSIRACFPGATGPEPAQVDQLAATATETVEKNEGKVTKTETWGLKNLAYKIDRNRKAHFVMLNIEGPGAVVQELERQTRINEDVIRYMTIRVDEHEEGPA